MLSEPKVSQPQVVNLDGRWIVRIANDNGRVQEYRCNSEEQAKQLVAVLVPVN
jgi:hypothetical protein